MSRVSRVGGIPVGSGYRGIELNLYICHTGNRLPIIPLKTL